VRNGAQGGAEAVAPKVLGSRTFKFLYTMSRGSRRAPDVAELQSVLIAEGYLQIQKPTSHFGSRTFAAVQAYQRVHAISPTGFVGERTRAELNNK
jgi:peptidoglycan hydrolase-like protein with peptidoglycan-binding domain